MAGYDKSELGPPLWLLAEVTYSCPLQCAYCSNPVDLADPGKELSTDEWKRVLTEARKLGALQLGFSGGEPMVRRDLEEIVAHATDLGFYTNLISSGVGLDRERLARLKEAGMDHIQISFQGSEAETGEAIAATKAFNHKVEVAHLVHEFGYPMVFNVVLHRHNLDDLPAILDLAESVEAEYVELANVQYHGWAWINRDQLMPTPEQIARAQEIAETYKKRLAGKMEIFFVWSDYLEGKAKPCMNGWGTTFMGVAPDGAVMPCHGARMLPGIELPNVREHDLGWIWRESDAFNKFRGYDWMQEPCRSCDFKYDDFGGCRCQAYLLTGDPAATDPACPYSPEHYKVQAAVAAAEEGRSAATELVFRNPKNSKKFIREQRSPEHPTAESPADSPADS